jgi:uncharacterized protein YyaL (SSP411 family)
LQGGFKDILAYHLEKQNDLFWDNNNGGFFAVEGGDQTLLLRMKEDYDGAEPCNNSVSALNLLR